MGRALEQKKKVVAELKDKFDQSKTIILTDYRGLNVAEMTELRRQLREAGVDYKVVKNTLVRIAARDLGLDFLDSYLVGPTAIAFSEDPVAPAKVLCKFADDHQALELKAGIMDGKLIGMDSIKQLANLPSREMLLAQVLAGMKAPITGLVNVLNGPLRSLVYVLQAVKDKKEKQQ
jgi:large subunit ribosomal protein L10